MHKFYTSGGNKISRDQYCTHMLALLTRNKLKTQWGTKLALKNESGLTSFYHTVNPTWQTEIIFIFEHKEAPISLKQN